jgi:Toprim domain
LFDTFITHAWSGGDFLYDQFEAFCIFIYGVYVQLNLSYLIQQLGSIQLNLSYSILQERSSYFINLINLQNKISQVSRIILATDADGPGQALAEELARRLGKERYLLFCLYFFFNTSYNTHLNEQFKFSSYFQVLESQVANEK